MCSRRRQYCGGSLIDSLRTLIGGVRRISAATGLRVVCPRQPGCKRMLYKRVVELCWQLERGGRARSLVRFRGDGLSDEDEFGGPGVAHRSVLRGFQRATALLHVVCGAAHSAVLRRSEVVPPAGLEPARPYGQGILSPKCLPFHHEGGHAAGDFLEQRRRVNGGL